MQGLAYYPPVSLHLWGDEEADRQNAWSAMDDDGWRYQVDGDFR